MSYDPALGNPGDFFYHYTTRQAAFEEILPKRRLRLSPAFCVGDPLESDPSLLTAAYWLGSDDDDADRSRQARSLEAMIRLQRLRRCSKVLSLTIDAVDYEGDAEIFGRGYSRARMWEQYAERHQGVCLMFHRDRLRTAILAELQARSSDTWDGPVAYTQTGILGDAAATMLPGLDKTPDEVIHEHVHRHPEAIFFTKLMDWQSEHEYRFVESSIDEEYTYIDVGDTLAGVILGHRFPRWQTAGVFGLCEKSGAQPWQMSWDISRPSPHQISQPPGA